jgi:hypothetical protein
MKSFDKCGDRFIVGDFQNLKTHIQESSDVGMQWFILVIPFSFKVVLVARLLASGYEVVNECLA